MRDKLIYFATNPWTIFTSMDDSRVFKSFILNGFSYFPQVERFMTFLLLFALLFLEFCIFGIIVF